LNDIALGACASFLAAEIWAHADPISRWFIQRAVLRLPENERARRNEEWLAHLDDTPGALRKLFHAIGCWSGAPAVGRAAVGHVQRGASAALAVIVRERLGRPVVRPYSKGRSTVLLLSGAVSGASIYSAVRIMMGPMHNPWLEMLLGVIAGAAIYVAVRLSYQFLRGR